MAQSPGARSFEEMDVTYEMKNLAHPYARDRSNSESKDEFVPEGWPLRLQTDTAGIVIKEETRPIFQKSTVVPLLSALALTLLPAIGLMIYIVVTRVATISDCNDAIEVPSCTITQRSVILDDPVQRFLTVTKVVDTVQQLATVWTLTLAAFLVADTWLQSPDNPLTSKTLALVVNMYASGRWWTLYDSSVSMYQKTAKLSRPFIHAIVFLLTTLILSRVVTGIDFWLHYVSRESTFQIGTPTVAPEGSLNSFMFSRTPNTTCYSTNGVSRQLGVPCTINPSSIGSDILTWPAEGSSLAVNQSTSDVVSMMFFDDETSGQTNMAIVTPAANVADSATRNYNASTIGLSVACESITSACDLLLIAHGTGGYNCSSLGEPNFSDLLSTGYQPGVVTSYLPARFVNGSTTSADPVTRYYLLALLAGNGTEFSSGGGTNNPAALTMARCSIRGYRVNYTYTAPIPGFSNSQLTLQSRLEMSKNETDTFIAPFTTTTPYIEDALAASKGAAQISTASFIRTLSQEIARYSLAYDAMAWSPRPAVSVSTNPELKIYSVVPVIPLCLFFAFVLIYVLFILALFFLTMKTGRESVSVPGRLHSQRTTLTNLTQRRLVRTDFLLHQLLATDDRKSTVTDADNIFRGEEDTPVVIGTHSTSGVFGIYIDDSSANSPSSMTRAASHLGRKSTSGAYGHGFRRRGTEKSAV